MASASTLRPVTRASSSLSSSKEREIPLIDGTNNIPTGIKAATWGRRAALQNALFASALARPVQQGHRRLPEVLDPTPPTCLQPTWEEGFSLEADNGANCGKGRLVEQQINPVQSVTRVRTTIALKSIAERPCLAGHDIEMSKSNDGN